MKFKARCDCMWSLSVENNTPQTQHRVLTQKKLQEEEPIT